MTLEDWKRVLEDRAQAGDLTGLAVAADGLSDCGEEGLADTLRWLVRKSKPPVVQEGANFEWYAGLSVHIPRTNPERPRWASYTVHLPGFFGTEYTLWELLKKVQKRRKILLETLL